MDTKLNCICGQKTKVVFAGNISASDWRAYRKKKKLRYVKLKKPSAYRITLECEERNCRSRQEFTGTSKADVLERIHVERRKQKKEAGE